MSYAADTRPRQARFYIALFTWNGRMDRITYFFWFFLLWAVLSVTAFIVVVAVATGIALATDPSLMNRTGGAPTDLRGHSVLQPSIMLFYGYLALSLTGTSALMTKRLRDAGWPVWLMPASMALLLSPLAPLGLGPAAMGGPILAVLFALLLMWPASRPADDNPPIPPSSTES